jgi:ribosome-associated protein
VDGLVTASSSAVELAIVAARAAADRKAGEVVALDVSDRLALTDVFLLASGTSERQVIAIAEGIEEALGRQGVGAIRREGVRDGRWALLDFGDLVVHVQHAEDRIYYALDRLWSDCPVVGLPEDLYQWTDSADVAL